MADVRKLKSTRLCREIKNLQTNQTSAKTFLQRLLRERMNTTVRGKLRRNKSYYKRLKVSHKKTHLKTKLNCFGLRNRTLAAPKNTNDFIMNDYQERIQEVRERHQDTVTNSVEMTSENEANISDTTQVRYHSSFNSEKSNEDDFSLFPSHVKQYLKKEFTVMYQNIRIESLHDMSKKQLVEHALQLETKLESFEERLSTKNNFVLEETAIDNNEEVIMVKKIIDFEEELEKCKALHEKLEAENVELKNKIIQVSVSSEIDKSSSADSSSESDDLSDSSSGIWSIYTSSIDNEINDNDEN